MPLLLALLIFSFSSFAELQRLIVKEGNFTYHAPAGTGDVEKILLGLSKNQHSPYAIEILREETALVLRSEIIDFSWQDPMPFFHNLEKFFIQQANIALDRKAHFVKTPLLIMRPQGGGDFSLGGLELNCNGNSVDPRILNRLMDDCVEHMDGHVQRMEVPALSFIANLLKELPVVPDEAALPAWDLDLLMNQGDFKLDFRIKYYMNAGVHTWGHVQFEKDYEILAIRLDRVRYGYFTITSLIFKLLRERVQDGTVSIEEPWIRIKMRKEK